VLWKQGDAADGVYVIGAGVLRATYSFAHTPAIEESMVPGTLAGELSGLAGLPRNATVVAERAAVLWYLSEEALGRLGVENPELARTFTALVLKGACCHVMSARKRLTVACGWCGSCEIGFRYFALCFGDKTMNDPDVMLYVKRRTENQGCLAEAITYLYRLVVTVFTCYHCFFLDQWLYISF
jgi:Cyclic nucleotide-binding domain